MKPKMSYSKTNCKCKITLEIYRQNLSSLDRQDNRSQMYTERTIPIIWFCISLRVFDITNNLELQITYIRFLQNKAESNCNKVPKIHQNSSSNSIQCRQLGYSKSWNDEWTISNMSFPVAVRAIDVIINIVVFQIRYLNRTEI